MNEELLRYKQQLNLHHWKIDLQMVSEYKILSITKGLPCYGVVNMMYDKLEASIYIDVNVNDKKSILIHELLHILIEDLQLNIENDEIEERFINTLVKSIR